MAYCKIQAEKGVSNYQGSSNPYTKSTTYHSGNYDRLTGSYSGKATTTSGDGLTDAVDDVTNTLKKNAKKKQLRQWCMESLGYYRVKQEAKNQAESRNSEKKCEYSADCASGYMCKNGICKAKKNYAKKNVPQLGEKCKNIYDCAYGHWCYDGFCEKVGEQ